MSHQPSLECPNCGRSLVQGEEYCYFCELNVGKMAKSHSRSHHHGHSEHKTEKNKNFLSSLFSRFKARKHRHGKVSKK